MTWVHDDDRIPDSDTLFRRVPRANPSFLTRDLITGDSTVHPAAFSYRDDGMSVARLGLLSAANQTVADLPWPSDRYVIASFSVAAVRAGGGGVVDVPDPDDAVTGHAHAVVRTVNPPPDRKLWGKVRHQVLARHELVDLLNPN